MYGTLYLIPCPISDDTAPWDVLPAANRAVMDSLDYFIVENTRSARRFLSKAGVGAPDRHALQFRELNEHTVAGREVEELVKPLVEGRSAGVISEAGVPGVADPGALVVEPATAAESVSCRSSDLRRSSWRSWRRGSTDSRSPSTATCPSNRPNGCRRSAVSNAARTPKASRSSSSRPRTATSKLMEQLLQTLAPRNAADGGHGHYGSRRIHPHAPRPRVACRRTARDEQTPCYFHHRIGPSGGWYTI